MFFSVVLISVFAYKISSPCFLMPGCWSPWCLVLVLLHCWQVVRPHVVWRVTEGGDCRICVWGPHPQWGYSEFMARCKVVQLPTFCPPPGVTWSFGKVTRSFGLTIWPSEWCTLHSIEGSQSFLQTISAMQSGGASSISWMSRFCMPLSPGYFVKGLRLPQLTVGDQLHFSSTPKVCLLCSPTHEQVQATSYYSKH